MGQQRGSIADIFRFVGDFLVFLKKNKVLESYRLRDSDLKDAKNLYSNEGFVKQLFSYLVRLKALLERWSDETNLDDTIVERKSVSAEDGNPVKEEDRCVTLTIIDNAEDVLKENDPLLSEIPKTEVFEALFQTSGPEPLQVPVEYFAQKGETEEHYNPNAEETVHYNEESTNYEESTNNEESTNIDGVLAEEKKMENAKVKHQLTKTLETTIPKGGPYTCVVCDKELKNKTALTRHIRSHTGVKPYPCNSCGKGFSIKESLIAHLLRVHNFDCEIALSCPVCGKRFIRKNALDVHMTIHQKTKPFDCKICGKTFSQKVALEVHTAVHTGNLNYSCEICERRFASASALSKHRLSHGPPKFKCDICARTFYRHDVLKFHRKTRHGKLSAQACLCSKCGKTFRTKANLAAHMQIHSGDTKPRKPMKPRRRVPRKVEKKEPATLFLCSICGKKCFRLKEHELRYHTDTAPPRFVCSYCPKIFSQKAKLEQHIVGHLEEPKYYCGICGRRFKRKENLTRHIVLHADPQPYSCDLCNCRYSSRFCLRQHKKRHHSDQQSVNTFTCDVCGKKFLRKNTYDIHMKTHKGEYKYQCETCEKKFVKRSHYESHITSHRNDRPFQCDTCKCTYKAQKNLREHIKKVHPQVPSLEALVASLGADEVVGMDQTEVPVLQSVNSNPVVQEITFVQGSVMEGVTAVVTPFIVAELPE